MYLGDFELGSTMDFKFTTRRFTTGAPHGLAGSPALAAYPGNSTTEITAGVTLTVDFDGRTGLNHVRIVASSGNGYAAGTMYEVVITAGTVDSVSVVGEVVGRFSIEKAGGIFAAMKRGIVRGVVGAASTTTSIVTSSLDPAAGVTDQFKGRVVIFDKATTTANLRGQGTRITGSSSAGVLTVEQLTTAPVSTDSFSIF